MAGCNGCKFGRRKAVSGIGYSIRSVFDYCGHPDNLKKVKFDPVTGKNVYKVIKRSIHNKWNEDGNCSRYEKDVPPKLYPPQSE